MLDLMRGGKMRRVLLFLALLLIPIVFAAEQPRPSNPTPPITVPQNIMFQNCTKIFAVNKEKLFYLTLSSLSANRFAIDEVQTANGYIIFTVNRNKYLATIASVDSANSILKITPCNNVYNFPPGILLNTFKYIDLNLNTEIKS